MKHWFAAFIVTGILIFASWECVVYAEQIGQDISTGKSVSCSSSGKWGNVAYANDGNTQTLWECGSIAAPPWWQVDLGDERSIYKIRVFFRNVQENPTERKNIAILASDDKDFATYTVLGRLGSTEHERNSWWEFDVNTDKTFRYIRYSKTVAEYTVLTELQVIGNIYPLELLSSEYFPLTLGEKPKFTAKIQNTTIESKPVTVLLVLNRNGVVIGANANTVLLDAGAQLSVSAEMEQELSGDLNGLSAQGFVFESFEQPLMVGPPLSEKLP